MGLHERFIKNKKLLHDNRAKFNFAVQVDHPSASLSDYMDAIYGFNIYRFMDDFFPSNAETDVSPKEEITAKYGQEFADMIEEML
jgi:hypothetical protein